MADPKDPTVAALLARIEQLEARLSQQLPGGALRTRLTQLQITVLEDHAIETGRRKQSFIDESTKPSRKVEWENVHGLSLYKDQELVVDVLEEQLPAFQAAVDAGKILVRGMPKSKGAPGARA